MTCRPAKLKYAAIADLLGVRPFLGHDAVSSRVLRLTKRQAVIHIASHGVYESRDPLLSGIILADGRVSVEDLWMRISRRTCLCSAAA